MALILVVEDEPAIRNVVARFLNSLGHEVRTADTGKQALDVIEAEDLDLLITDINMPDMDGIEMLNELRRRGSTLPVIAISGGGQFSKELLLGSATMLGAVRSIEKPFELDELRGAVDEVLAP